MPASAAARTTLLSLAALLLLTAAGAQASAGTHPARKPQGAFYTHHYRNLFAERGHTRAEIDARVDATYQHYFHGDKQTETLLYAAGQNSNGPLAYATDVANRDVRTEGMSYAMMIAVQMDRRADFDAVWNWANTYMLITDPKNPSAGYFAWSMNTDGTPRSDSPAPDGEEYFVMSLYFAAHRWGNGQGLYNYKEQADRLLTLMRHHPVVRATGPFRIHPEDAPFVPPGRPGSAAGATPRMTEVGPMVNEAAHMILFVPGASGSGFTDPSYHLPAFYQLWSLWGPVEDRAFWATAAETSRKFFSEATNPTTGLAPDYSNFDGSPHRVPWNPQSGNASYDSWRVISNWSVDSSWWARNPQAQGLSDKLQGFLFARGIHTFPEQFTLDGKTLAEHHAPGLVATAAIGSLAATDGPVSRAFVDELWNTPPLSGNGRYYDGMLHMMAMLHLSGRFRIW